MLNNNKKKIIVLIRVTTIVYAIIFISDFTVKKYIRVAEFALQYFDHIIESSKLQGTYVMISSNMLK